MPFSQTLHTDLVSDIDEMFPSNREGEPASQIFVLQDPRAPIVTISRDPRAGEPIVPHFFFTTEDPDYLLQVSSVISRHNPDLMPLTHNAKGSLTGWFTLVPFLYDRNPSSTDFINKAKECGEALVTTDMPCAYTIMDCSLTIVSQGNVTKTTEYKAVFDHLVK
jgi:hypothetical protein